MSDVEIRDTTLGEGETTTHPDGRTMRYGLALPIAGVVTVVLTLSMAALIATEFTPQDKLETASYEINPQVDDIPDDRRIEEPDPLKEIETPPPPPRVAVDDVAPVDLPVIKVARNATKFEPTQLDFGGGFKVVPIDKDPTPLLRIPPVLPNRFAQGDNSGYCRVAFDVSPAGQPFNVTATSCTNAQLKSPTLKSVQEWKYAPKIQDGRPVTRRGLEATIQFELRDERGNLLPLPSGY